MFGRRTKDKLFELECWRKSYGDRLDSLEQTVKQSACEHKHIIWEDRYHKQCIPSPWHEYRKTCLDCGKILQGYKTKREWLKAQCKDEDVPERERRARDIIDPLTGMDERTRHLAEDYVVCLKENVMDEEKEEPCRCEVCGVDTIPKTRVEVTNHGSKQTKTALLCTGCFEIYDSLTHGQHRSYGHDRAMDFLHSIAFRVKEYKQGRMSNRV